MEALVTLSPRVLKHPAFLESGCAVALPAGRNAPPELIDALSTMAGHGHAVVAFATSGTTGVPKWVILTKRALKFSAEAVCRHLKVEPGERWICPLPVGHVGGTGVYLRALVSGGVVVHSEEKWSAGKFHETCVNEGVHWASLVPTQVYDLVAGKYDSPEGMRGVVVGGGKLDQNTRRRAIDCGWPILSSFGMTESASQIATEIPGGGGGMKVIDGWEVDVDDSSALKIRGEALFSGWLEADDHSEYELRSPVDDDGWFTTRDRVKIEQRNGSTYLCPLGRVDDFVKVLGELVCIQHLESELRELVHLRGGRSESVAVVAVPDERMGNRPVMVVEGHQPEAVEWRDLFNKSEIIPVERLTGIVVVRQFPRSELGKIQRKRLVEMVLDKL